MTPCYNSGPFATTPQIWSNDKVQFLEWWRAGHRLYRHVPYKLGYFCFDIDIHSGKPNGLRNWYGMLLSIYKTRENVPAELRNIERLPCYVLTPSGGFHLYFKVTGAIIYKYRLPESVEVKYTDWINAGYKNGAEYQLFGSLSSAPELPKPILYYLSMPPVVDIEYTGRKAKKSDMDILNEARFDGEYSSKHDIIVHIAYKAGPRGVPIDIVINYCRTDSFLSGYTDDIEYQVRHVYAKLGKV